MKYLKLRKIEATRILAKLLTSEDKQIERYTPYITIIPISFVMTILPYRFTMRQLLKLLEINGFEANVNKKNLFIATPNVSLFSELNKILDDVEMKQEKIQNSIQKASDNLKLALESNKILKSMLELSIENEKHWTKLLG
ncbi:hypothetical protein SteCoe_17969 [Stentor coeruleus]|uniref:Uncharacterized protein n=1 Tax=Stentor coeruleus TaxID=5963 RepID=A0A1R2BXN4_9CILI|nr:hypothetical protein SteCoe_17969 [Stentor coeruleus]